MARDTLSKKNSGNARSGQAAAAGRGKPLTLILAGATAVAIIAIAAFAVISTAGGGGGGAEVEGFTPNDEGLIPPGDQAPSFTAPTVDGGSVSLGEGGGARATMLVFFATWCPHCNREAPVISELEEQDDGLEVVMVGIDGEDDPAKVRAFVEEYDIESPAVYEPSLGPEYGVSGYPTTYVLDADNVVVGAHSGEAPREVYEGWIEEAL